MSPTPSSPGSERSAEAVNEEIRALWREADPRVQLTGETRKRYERLRAEWAAAVRAEVVEAA
ncbi:hypothetical protein ACFWCA_32940 [Streptomyces phaeochromogenes]|uniref:hypothetical protein n=1 Tax=Streptomyces phaeochromogenes TaxID=1923 RepID=UPI00369FCDFE